MRKTCHLMRPVVIQLITFVLALSAGLVIHKTVRWMISPVVSKDCISQDNSAGNVHVCEVHGERMALKYVSILPGLPGHPATENGYITAKARLFPNSNLVIIDRNRSTTEGHAKVNVCSKCRTAERLWLESNAQETQRRVRIFSGR